LQAPQETLLGLQPVPLWASPVLGASLWAAQAELSSIELQEPQETLRVLGDPIVETRDAPYQIPALKSLAAPS